MFVRNFTLALLPTLLLSACIQKEAPNLEADILCVSLGNSIKIRNEIDYFGPFETSVNAYQLDLEVDFAVDLSHISPEFTLSPGAEINPPGGIVQDFSSGPVRYTVTSENGLWHRTYSVSVHYPEIVELPDIMHFDDAEKDRGYYVFRDGPLAWSSGNPGFQLSMSSAPAGDYPTWFSSEGYLNGCVALTTRTTGSLGEMGGMPIAAGNLFLGKFVLSMAMGDALGATQFGIPYTHKPVALSGMYKYESGPRFLENGAYSGKKDHGNIYAIFFERDEQTRYLDGHDGAEGWKHPNMVALAQGGEFQETDDWTEFRIAFDYERYGRDIDSAKLADGSYCIAIVMSSSIDGGDFKGAPGSTLMVDEMVLEYE